MSAISHVDSLDAPDWSLLRLTPAEEAAPVLQGILTRLEGAEDRIFAVRGMCALLFEERELWTQFIDPEVGQPFQSLDRYLKINFPQSWGYIRDALRTVKECRAIPFEDLLRIRRCNLEQLKKVSSSVRILPDVVQAARQMPEKAFVAKMNTEHQQHLEVHAPIVMAPQAVTVRLDKAIEVAMLLWGCKSRGEALEAIAEDFLLSHSGDFETEVNAQ